MTVEEKIELESEMYFTRGMNENERTVYYKCNDQTRDELFRRVNEGRLHYIAGAHYGMYLAVQCLREQGGFRNDMSFENAADFIENLYENKP